MNKYFLTAATAIAGVPALACVTCDERLQSAIYDERVLPSLFLVLSGFLAVGLVVVILTAVALRHARSHVAINDPIYRTPVPLTAAAMVLGIGLGGFADGILLHQVLQWHEMLSARIPVSTLQGKSVNMFWDGIFHLLCLLITFVGVFLLWRVMRSAHADRSGKLLSGGMLIGWGAFNIIEGVINHQVLNLHNVRENDPNHAAWNYGFLGISLLMIGIGAVLIRNRKSAAENSRTRTTA
jgi:uncharacterized membrane protein